jgi:hypothetical protein
VRASRPGRKGRGTQPGPVVLLEDADLPAGAAQPALPLGQARRLADEVDIAARALLDAVGQ